MIAPTREELEKWALRIIGDVDYDIEKECELELEEEGECETVDDVIISLQLFFEEFNVKDEDESL